MQEWGKREAANKGEIQSRLVLWATGTQSFGKLLGERVQHSSVILPEGQRSWGVYPPTAISHWLKAAAGAGTHELTLSACSEGQAGSVTWKSSGLCAWEQAVSKGYWRPLTMFAMMGI